MDQINRTWAGAQCRNRIPITIKKGKDGKGWSQSPWYCVHGTAKAATYCLRFRVSDRDALRSLMDGKTLLPGARFIADGWAFEDPRHLKGLSLNFRFRDAPVRAQWIFMKYGGMSSGIGSTERVRNIERYMRLDAFEVRAQNEQLEAVTTVDEPAPAASAPISAPDAFNPTLRAMAASVEPARVFPGQEIRLIAVYAVEGVPPGAVVNVHERRTIRYGGQQLTSTDASVSRTLGVHQSTRPLQVPATLSAGVYELLVTIELEGVVEEVSAVFEVLERDR